MKTVNRKKLAYFVLAAVLTIGIAGWFFGSKHLRNETPAELTTVRVPIDIWPGNFWVTVADAKGFFEEEGLRAQIVDTSAEYNQLVDDFADPDKDFIDTMNYAVFDLVNKNIEGADLVAVFVSDSSEGAEGLVAKKEFAGLSDLKGKRIGVEVGSYLDFFLEVAMMNVDITPAEYTKVDMLTDDIGDNFEKEQLDAAFSWEPELSGIAAQYDLNKIFDTSHIRGLSPGVFVFKRQFIEKNPETMLALVRAWNKATEYILANREETYRLIAGTSYAEGGRYTYEEIEELAKEDLISTLENNLKTFSFNSGFESLYGNLQFVSRYFQKSMNLSAIPDTNKMLTDYFIRSINQ